MPARLAAVVVLLAAPVATLATPPPRTLAVAVAANLKPAFDEIARRFQADRPGVEVRASYGASGAFFAQIANGAPFDLFLSADAGYPAKLAEEGFVDGRPFTYAFGQLALWIPAGSPLDLARQGLAALLHPSVKKVALPNPDVAPYGRAARAALRQAGLWDRMKDKVVLGQSVAQAAQFAQSGNAQAGFVSRSLALAPPLAAEGRAWIVPAGEHQRIEQAGVVPRGARDAALARELAAFLSSPPARETLLRFGYDLPAP